MTAQAIKPDAIFVDALCAPRDPGGWGCWGWAAASVERGEEILGRGHGTIGCRASSMDTQQATYHGLLYALMWLQDSRFSGVRIYTRREDVLAQIRDGAECGLPGLRDAAIKLSRKAKSPLLYQEGENIASPYAAQAFRECLRERCGGEAAQLVCVEAITDPAPEFPEDSALWAELLHLARDTDWREKRETGEGLNKALHDLRLFGARIVERGKGYRIRPTIGADGCSDELQWRALLAQYPVLTPEAVSALLQELSPEEELV